ncbi:hypothetical protein [Williamsia phyllosphaerae]|uniref:Uncharacterized protein n=1 Tax=Williamsia phyllosphaerae TaxID=885042 RepID=A0ABQ1V724_9NOCA|nr:hypothetical protein [Williamsia phyllosphaerae]GGF38882.1 hypothetical protein GCM10007298_38220 [Williamsia phyllosphaerae]
MSTQEVDLLTAAAANSDQIEAGDFLTGPRIVTIESVSRGSAEQPVNIHLVEFPGRAFRPCKSMIRVLLAAWGEKAQTYVGRRMQLYRDPKVVFGGKEVGGVRISALSHIEKSCTVQLMVTRGRRAPFTVEPLAEQPSKIRLDEAKIAASTLEQCGKARDYLTKFKASEPERATELLALVAKRETELAGDTA